MENTFEHESVLLNEVVTLLNPQSGGVYCDATIGGGGHAEKILEASAPDGKLIGIDRDIEAVKAAKKRLAKFGDRVSVYHGKFSELESLMEEAKIKVFDGLLLDLGVSSYQLNMAMRGFSFTNPGPIDMRMDTTTGESAKQMLSKISEDELADIIFKFGEEKMSRKIARSIKQMEREGMLNTTSDLEVAVKRVTKPSKPGMSNRATKTFQAIRIAINDELGELEKVLSLLPEPLAIGGAVVIITFHSLEDRMVKRKFESLVNTCQCPPGMPVCKCAEPKAVYNTRRSVKVSGAERDRNRRSRSAIARSVRRIR